MMRNQHGFSLVELMVALVVFIFAIVAATTIFIPLVSQFKQQSKITETNIEGLVGLWMLKTDLEQAGYGLPWFFPNDTITYTETSAAPAGSTISSAVVNDSPGNPPRAVAAFNNIDFSGQVNGNANITRIAKYSDYLVIKSASVSGTDTAQKWSYIMAANEPNPRTWGATGVPGGAAGPNDPSANDNVIVINPMVSATRLRELVMNGTAFSTKFSSLGAFSPPAGSSQTQTYVIYDIDANNSLNMPFNRADYFVGIPAAMPTRCASGIGVLYKAVLSQSGTFDANNTMPLLDCVADMQVIFGLDMDGNGTIDTYANADGSSAADATTITGEGRALGGSAPGVLGSHSNLSDYRSSVVEIRVYILAHEGQIDPMFTFTAFTIGACPKCVRVGQLGSPDLGMGRDFDLSTIPNYLHYRWKVYTMVVKLQNMR